MTPSPPRHDGKSAEIAQHQYSVAMAIGAGPTPAAIVADLNERVAAALAGSWATVLMEDGTDLAPLHGTWAAPTAVETARFALDGAGLPQKALRAAAPLIADVDLDGATPSGLTGATESQTAIAIPIVCGEAAGVLLVGSGTPGDFGDAALEIASAIAAPAGAVVAQVLRLGTAQDAAERLAEVAQLKSDFVAVVSHELRTPLTSMIGSLQTLQRPALAHWREDARQLVATASRQADRLLALIQDLLVAARIDNHAVAVRSELVVMEHLLMETVTEIVGASSRVVVDAPGITAILDPHHVRRILVNLIENAMRHAGHGQVEVSASVLNGSIRIAVVDHGLGIPDNAEVFGRFTQHRRQEIDGRGGLGMGLSIVQGLTKAMGGSIHHQPTPGGGATFVVSLPERPRSLAASA